MLDELGNLQSEGHGISGFETMLSIGLGQEQQFTLILQTLQQLKDVYGDSVDKIVQGNTSNIVFLKSTDDAMIDTLSKMSGITHITTVDGKTVTRDLERIAMKNEGKISYNVTTKERAVITYNDFAFISERNSIVLRAGDSPIWNRNETILPMSWRLFKDTIVQPGKDYSLQTIPTLSSAVEFDVRKNQPDFAKMLNKRMAQAFKAAEAKELYQTVYDYSDYDIEQLDPDNYADDIMDMINRALNDVTVDDDGVEHMSDEELEWANQYDADEGDWYGSAEVNKEQLDATAEQEAKVQMAEVKLYAGKLLSKADLVLASGQPTHYFDKEIINAYIEVGGAMRRDTAYFTSRNGSLYSEDGKTSYIIKADDSETLATLREASKNEESNVYAEEDLGNAKQLNNSYTVTDDFYQFLVSLNSWKFANNEFERVMKAIINKR